MRFGGLGTERAAALFAHLDAPGLSTERPPPSLESRTNSGNWEQDLFKPLLDVLDRVPDPRSASQIFELLLGQSEAALGEGRTTAPGEAWCRARRRRELTSDDVGELAALPSALKLLFNYYFRDDLYGRWVEHDPIILSSGSFDEKVFGLSDALKDCIGFALSQNWYGYSDSRGRVQTREALAALESQTNPGSPACRLDEICVTMGATAAIGSLADFIAAGRPRTALRAICGVPNYVPLVAAVSRQFTTRLTPTPLVNGTVDINDLIERAQEGVDLILLQTVNNPWGAAVDGLQLQRLIDVAPANCTILLDMCHEHFGVPALTSPSASLSLIGSRAAKVVFVRSLSKQWAVPGLKCGWIRAPTDLIDAFYDHASTTYGGPPSFFSLLLEVYARFEALRLSGLGDAARLEKGFSKEYGLNAGSLSSGFDHYVRDREAFIDRVHSNRTLCGEMLVDVGVQVVSANYSINLLCQHGQLPDYATYRRLVRDFNVSVFPGSLCMTSGPGVFRVSPCLSPSALAEGLNRIRDWARQAE